MKLKLRLNGDEVLALEQIVGKEIAKISVEELREQPALYACMACVVEIFEKVAPKAREQKMFGQNSFALTLTRAQAIAFDWCFAPADQPADEATYSSYEFGLLVRICGEIMVKYYS